MNRYIKVRTTIINAEDIESVYPDKYRDRNGFEQDKVVVKLRNGNTHNFGIKSTFDVQEFVDDIYNQLCSQALPSTQDGDRIAGGRGKSSGPSPR